jgi:hypothetical protein
MAQSCLSVAHVSSTWTVRIWALDVLGVVNMGSFLAETMPLDSSRSGEDKGRGGHESCQHPASSIPHSCMEPRLDRTLSHAFAEETSVFFQISHIESSITISSSPRDALSQLHLSSSLRRRLYCWYLRRRLPSLRYSRISLDAASRCIAMRIVSGNQPWRDTSCTLWCNSMD